MKRFFMIAVALLPLMLLAQARIGIVNSQELFDLMPEKAEAEARRLAKEKRENSFWNKAFKGIKKFGKSMIEEEEE